jgi:hypothetical protein
MVKLFDMSLPIDKIKRLAIENLAKEYKLTNIGGKSKKRKQVKRKKVRQTRKK